MSIFPLILNIAAVFCGLICAAIVFQPKATPGVRVFFGVVGVLAILRGVL